MFRTRPRWAAGLLLLGGTIGSAYAAAPNKTPSDAPSLVRPDPWKPASPPPLGPPRKVPPSDTQGLSIDLNFRPRDSKAGNYQMSVGIPSTRPSDMSFGLCRNQSMGATDLFACAQMGATGENQMMLNMQISK